MARSVSVAYPALQAKKLSWADHMDSVEEAQNICEQENVTLEEFARLIHHVLPRCELDTTKTAHHFQIGDTFVDIMYRDHVLISVSKKRGPDPIAEDDEDDEEEATDEEGDEGDEEDETAVSEDEEDIKAIEAELKVVAASTAAIEQKEEVDEVLVMVPPPPLEETAAEVVPTPAAAAAEEGWTTVVSKRGRQVQAARNVLDRLDHKSFYFFANEANDHYMDFVGVVQGLDGLLSEAQKHRWSHGYHLEGNTVYDFNDATRPGLFRCFMPNTAYLHKFKVWFDEYEAQGEQVPVDTREFHVFRENSTWPVWTSLGVVFGLSRVRRTVMNSGSEYGHAYCLETNDLANFWLTDGHFRQSCHKAPLKYIDRFEKYCHENPSAASASAVVPLPNPLNDL